MTAPPPTVQTMTASLPTMTPSLPTMTASLPTTTPPLPTTPEPSIELARCQVDTNRRLAFAYADGDTDSELDVLYLYEGSSDARSAIPSACKLIEYY